MAKNITPRLADDIRASLHEALDYAAGKGTKAVVHRVVPHDTDAREARLKLGLSQLEFASFIGTAVGTVRKWELGTRRPSGAARTLIDVIKAEPRAVRRALMKG
ncbi:MAG TPA: helix-turn-helix domain-containing protein [Blastocatellia bacterium]|jgi:putative transcriptional regulator|nr:helix-turn-helix domain-containing protein [Blastocatellia bacterium]